MLDDPAELAAALGPNLRAARLCIDVAERELAVALNDGGEGRLGAVPARRLRDFDRATSHVEGSLTRLLSHMAPHAAETLALAARIQRANYRSELPGSA